MSRDWHVLACCIIAFAELESHSIDDDRDINVHKRMYRTTYVSQAGSEVSGIGRGSAGFVSKSIGDYQKSSSEYISQADTKNLDGQGGLRNGKSSKDADANNISGFSIDLGPTGLTHDKPQDMFAKHASSTGSDCTQYINFQKYMTAKAERLATDDRKPFEKLANLSFHDVQPSDIHLPGKVETIVFAAILAYCVFFKYLALKEFRNQRFHAAGPAVVQQRRAQLKESDDVRKGVTVDLLMQVCSVLSYAASFTILPSNLTNKNPQEHNSWSSLYIFGFFMASSCCILLHIIVEHGTLLCYALPERRIQAHFLLLAGMLTGTTEGPKVIRGIMLILDLNFFKILDIATGPLFCTYQTKQPVVATMPDVTCWNTTEHWFFVFFAGWALLGLITWLLSAVLRKSKWGVDPFHDGFEGEYHIDGFEAEVYNHNAPNGGNNKSHLRIRSWHENGLSGFFFDVVPIPSKSVCFQMAGRSTKDGDACMLVKPRVSNGDASSATTIPQQHVQLEIERQSLYDLLQKPECCVEMKKELRDTNRLQNTKKLQIKIEDQSLSCYRVKLLYTPCSQDPEPAFMIAVLRIICAMAWAALRHGGARWRMTIFATHCISGLAAAFITFRSKPYAFQFVTNLFCITSLGSVLVSTASIALSRDETEEPHGLAVSADALSNAIRCLFGFLTILLAAYMCCCISKSRELSMIYSVYSGASPESIKISLEDWKKYIIAMKSWPAFERQGDVSLICRAGGRFVTHFHRITHVKGVEFDVWATDEDNAYVISWLLDTHDLEDWFNIRDPSAAKFDLQLMPMQFSMHLANPSRGTLKSRSDTCCALRYDLHGWACEVNNDEPKQIGTFSYQQTISILLTPLDRQIALNRETPFLTLTSKRDITLLELRWTNDGMPAEHHFLTIDPVLPSNTVESVSSNGERLKIKVQRQPRGELTDEEYPNSVLKARGFKVLFVRGLFSFEELRRLDNKHTLARKSFTDQLVDWPLLQRLQDVPLEYARAMVIGNSGAGKSTLLAALARYVSQNKWLQGGGVGAMGKTLRARATLQLDEKMLLVDVQGMQEGDDVELIRRNTIGLLDGGRGFEENIAKNLCLNQFLYVVRATEQRFVRLEGVFRTIKSVFGPSFADMATIVFTDAGRLDSTSRSQNEKQQLVIQEFSKVFRKVFESSPPFQAVTGTFDGRAQAGCVRCVFVDSHAALPDIMWKYSLAEQGAADNALVSLRHLIREAKANEKHATFSTCALPPVLQRTSAWKEHDGVFQLTLILRTFEDISVNISLKMREMSSSADNPSWRNAHPLQIHVKPWCMAPFGRSPMVLSHQKFQEVPHDSQYYPSLFTIDLIIKRERGNVDDKDLNAILWTDVNLENCKAHGGQDVVGYRREFGDQPRAMLHGLGFAVCVSADLSTCIFRFGGTTIEYQTEPLREDSPRVRRITCYASRGLKHELGMDIHYWNSDSRNWEKVTPLRQAGAPPPPSGPTPTLKPRSSCHWSFIPIQWSADWSKKVCEELTKLLQDKPLDDPYLELDYEPRPPPAAPGWQARLESWARENHICPIDTITATDKQDKPLKARWHEDKFDFVPSPAQEDFPLRVRASHRVRNVEEDFEIFTNDEEVVWKEFSTDPENSKRITDVKAAIRQDMFPIRIYRKKTFGWGSICLGDKYGEWKSDIEFKVLHTRIYESKFEFQELENFHQIQLDASSDTVSTRRVLPAEGPLQNEVLGLKASGGETDVQDCVLEGKPAWCGWQRFRIVAKRGGSGPNQQTECSVWLHALPSEEQLMKAAEEAYKFTNVDIDASKLVMVQLQRNGAQMQPAHDTFCQYFKDTLESDLKGFQSISHVWDTIEKYRTEYNGKMNAEIALKAEIKNLEGKLDQREREIKDHKKGIKQLQDTNSEQEQQITGLNGRVSTLEVKNEALTTQLEEKDEEIKKRDGLIKQLQDIITRLKNELQPETPMPDVDDSYDQGDHIASWLKLDSPLRIPTTLTGTWWDQGWGNQKSHLFAKLPSGWVRFSSSPAPHTSESFEFSVPVGCEELGYCVAVGMGGGHHLYIKDAKLM